MYGWIITAVLVAINLHLLTKLKSNMRSLKGINKGLADELWQVKLQRDLYKKRLLKYTKGKSL